MSPPAPRRAGMPPRASAPRGARTPDSRPPAASPAHTPLVLLRASAPAAPGRACAVLLSPASSGGSAAGADARSPGCSGSDGKENAGAVTDPDCEPRRAPPLRCGRPPLCHYSVQACMHGGRSV